MTLLHEHRAIVASAEPPCIAIFGALKRDTGGPGVEPFELALSDNAGRLVPVTDRHLGDAELLTEFSRWRAENSFAFPTQFPVTNEGTARWLRHGLLEVRDRMLFLVQASDGTLIGHLGYANCLGVPGEMEIDNVVRGVKGGAPGIMETSMRRITSWAVEAFAPDLIHLRVFSHNEHAIRFYERCEFVTVGQLPLRRTEVGDRITFTPPVPDDTAPPDAWFTRMVLQRRGMM